MPSDPVRVGRYCIPKLPFPRGCAILLQYSTVCYPAQLALTAAAFDSIVFLPEVLSWHRRHTSAYTYIVPTSNSRKAGNIFRWVRRTWLLHKEVREGIDQRLMAAGVFLARVESDKPVLKQARHMIRLYTSHSRLDFLRLQFFCMKNYPLLIYSFSGRRTCAGYLRGFYFPISCSDYFRFLASTPQHATGSEEEAVTHK